MADEQGKAAVDAAVDVLLALPDEYTEPICALMREKNAALRAAEERAARAEAERNLLQRGWGERDGYVGELEAKVDAAEAKLRAVLDEVSRLVEVVDARAASALAREDRYEAMQADRLATALRAILNPSGDAQRLRTLAAPTPAEPTP